MCTLDSVCVDETVMQHSTVTIVLAGVSPNPQVSVSSKVILHRQKQFFYDDAKDKGTITESHDAAATSQALAECDLVCHLAADPEVRIGAENIDSHFRENLASRLFCSAISSWPGRSSPCARSRSKRPKTKVRVIDLAGKSRPSITDLCYARNH